ncbi:MAG: aquaporin family protein [Parachlamydiales bacterium]|nr:aquaporin family protein [Verrucomicrobiota bacterium]MBX3719793.1 aquaporin family protein [Candidatus Acheromyda pituitae]
MNIFLAELIGTMLLILLGNGAVANVLLVRSKGYHSGWIVITAGWGFAVAIAVYTTGWISGGHINPAVTLGLTLAGKSPVALMPIYIIAQFLGALLGAVLVYLCYQPHWKMTLEPHPKLLCFATAPAIRRPFWNFITEVIGTAVLLMGILGIFNVHNGIASGMGPYAVGILIFSIGLSLGGPTGYAINPARDLGPRLAHFMLPIPGKGSSDWKYAWVPILGPLVGSAVGVFLYQQFVSKLLAL